MPIRLQSPFKLYQREPEPKKPSEPSPVTYGTTTTAKTYWFSPRTRDYHLLDKLHTAYRQGGLIAEAIDCYPLFILSPGFRFESKDEGLIRLCEQKAQETNLTSALWCGIVDSCIFGDGFQEQAPNAIGDYWGPISRNAKQFEILTDKKGTVTGYRHFYKTGAWGEEYMDLKKDQILHYRLWDIGGEVYGLSLVERALKEIERDFMIAESTALAIERHGSPKYHIRPGTPGQDRLSTSTLQAIGEEYKDMSAKHEFVTQPDFTIDVLDATGVTGVEEYNRMSITRVSTALGVPEEVLGLGRGSTEATANVRLQAWFKKIQTLAKRIESIVNPGVVDRWTGKPGECKLIFNDASPVDEDIEVNWMVKLVTATQMDPWAVITPEYIRKRLGIVIEEYEEEAAKTKKPEMLER